MILFDLICGHGHGFEAWFRNGDAFDEQREGEAIVCPACGTTDVAKAPMAPHVARRTPPPGRGSVAAGKDDHHAQSLRGSLEALRRQVEATCDYVGDRFAEEARRIHYGEIEARSIFGEASTGEAQALADEGVAVQRLPWLPRRND
ncbi:MAG: DUF1178 family protein [Rhodospirillales bacterium]|nr:MAG: DUF1178 family protein [Rhodospirillales bacterium]